MTRIAVFIKSTTLHKNHGGLESQNKTLCEGLAKAGGDVTVFSPSNEESLQDTTINGVKYIFIPVSYTNSGFIQSISSPSAKSRFFSASSERFLREHEKAAFNIIVSQSIAGLGAIRISHKLGLPVISIAHGSALSEFRTRLGRYKKGFFESVSLLKDLLYVLRSVNTVQKEIASSSNVVVCVSDFVAGNLIKETGIEASKIKVIYNGVEATSPINRGVSAKGKVLYVGRIEEEKGLGELLRELCGRDLNDSTIEIVGEGVYLEELKKIASSLDCSTKVNFYGYLSGASLAKVYQDASLFVLPTKRIEGFPVTIVEAMMAGLPTVAMNMGGISEGISDGNSGFLISKGDWKEFGNKVEQLLSDPETRTRMGLRAREIALAQFSEERMVKNYIEVMESLLKK